MKRWLIVPAILLSPLGQQPSLAQTTITVGQGVGYDYGAIQAGIDAATTGDVVVVYPGIYYENIRLHGNNIVLRSTDPTSAGVVAATIIDGGSTGTVVTFAGSESSSCVLWGFTIRKGSAWRGGTYFGGGIQGNGTRASILNNIITNNYAAGGAGIHACNGTIQNNIITNNSASYDGGGIYQCHGTIRGNVIAHNGATFGSGGAGRDCDGLIVNNLVFRNSARYSVPGLDGCDGIIQNNTIVDNRGGYGDGGLSGSGTVSNCIVWGNPRGLFGVGWQVAGTTPTYSCIQNWTGGGEGNIASYPWFADANYYLLPKSPCVDAGNPAAEYNDACRPPALGASRNDMGAYGGPQNCLWPAPPPSARARNWCMYE